MLHSIQVGLEVFRYRLIQNAAGLGEVSRLHQQLDSAKQIRNKPVHAHHVFVGQVAFDSRSLQPAFCKQCFRYITESAKYDQVSPLRAC